MTELLWGNPEIIRHMRSRLRRGRLLGTLGLYLLFVLLMAYILFQTNSSANADATQQYAHVLYFVLLGIQYFASLVIGCVICAGSIVAERENQTYDFLRMLPIEPIKLIVGKLIGVPILIYLVLAVTLPLNIICAFLAGLPWSVVLTTYLILIFAGFFSHSLGLFYSALAPKAQISNGGALFSLFILSMFLWTPGINFLHPMRYFEFFWEKKAIPPVGFFTLEMPAILMAVLIYSLFSAWFLVAIYRTLEYEHHRVFSKKQSVLFQGFVSLIALGLMWPHLTGIGEKSQLWGLVALYMCLQLGLIMGMLFTLTPDYDDLIQWFYTLTRPGAPVFHQPFAEHSPMFGVLLAYIGVAAVTTGTIALAFPDVMPMIVSGIALLTLYAGVYGVLFLLMHTWWSPFNRNYIVAGLIVLSMIFPLFGGEPSVYFILNPFFLLVTLVGSNSLGTYFFASIILALVILIGLTLWLVTRLTLMRQKLQARRYG